MEITPLFETAELRKLKLKNRLVMAPMTTISGENDGSFSEQEIKYLSQRAEDGIGMIITPACYVHKSGHSFERQVGCHTDKMIPSMTKLTDSINKYGAASILQLHHGGNAAKQAFSGVQPIAPSAVKNRSGRSELPKELSVDEIKMLIESFAKAGLRAKKAGFSGIEIHGANTYLLQQFFSAYTNKRSDRWGAELSLPVQQIFENRTRFAREVVKAVRSEVGEDFMVIYRISPEEADPLGYSTYDTIDFLRDIVPCGIDMIDVSSWSFHENLRNDIPPETNPTSMINSAFPDLPVIGVGGITMPEQALEVRSQGIDFVALGKILMLEKDWVKKVQNGDTDQIRTAITTEGERQALEIPDRMKEYSKNFFKI